MKYRYESFRLEADKDIVFEIVEGEGRELVIRAKNRLLSVNVYSQDYINPPVPEGYTHVCGEWNNGFVIERSADGSQFVWVPVGSLDEDGTLDGENFSEKFGRRNYQEDMFSAREFHEELAGEVQEQLESVKKYGGFYISRYNISESAEGAPQSVKGAMPKVNVNFNEAKASAALLETGDALKSHLVLGAEYDSVLAWFIKSGAKSREMIAENSTAWGNHWNTDGAAQCVVATGSSEDWCANGIYDLAGNVDEWTQEENGNSLRVVRGGNYYYDGYNCPISYRCAINPFRNYNNTSYRIALWIK